MSLVSFNYSKWEKKSQPAGGGGGGEGRSGLKQNEHNSSDTYQKFVSQNRNSKNPPEEKVKRNHKQNPRIHVTLVYIFVSSKCS